MILKIYIVLLNVWIVGFAYYLDKVLKSLKDRVEVLESKPITRSAGKPKDTITT